MAVNGGHCYCGAVAFEVRTEPVKIPLCHCHSCRRATGAPMIVAAGYRHADIRFTGEVPHTFSHDGRVTRGFCRRCGTPISYRRAESDYTFLFVGIFNEPNQLAPEVQMMVDEKLAWLHLGDDLPVSHSFS